MNNTNYELFEEIGRGTLTIVYRGYDHSLKRSVAIKSLQDGASEHQQERFVQQARFLASLNHTGLLNVYAFDASSGNMVMELLAGSLKDRIVAGNLPPKLCFSVLKQAIEALSYLRNLKLVHGSIRPSNILIDDNGKIKLSDFVSVKFDGVISAPEFQFSRYVPPELWAEEKYGPVDSAMDLYSLGMTMLECLNNKALESTVSGLGTYAEEVVWSRWHTSADHDATIEKLVGKLGTESSVLCAILKQKALERPQKLDDLLTDMRGIGFVPATIAPVPDEREPPPNFNSSASGQFGVHTEQKKRNYFPAKFDLSDKVCFRWAMGIVCTLSAIFGITYNTLKGNSQQNILVIVEPSDAKVSLKLPDSELRVLAKKGEAQVLLSLPVGSYAIIAERQDYETHEQPFEIKQVSRDTQSIAFKLEQARVRVVFKVVPSNSDIFIDDAKMPLDVDSKLSLLPGSHQLIVRKSGYKEEKQQITIVPNQSPISVMLSALVTIKVVPEDATVFMDGERIEPIEPRESRKYLIGPSKHRLSISLEGYETLEQDFQAEGGKVVSFSLRRIVKTEPTEKSDIRTPPTIPPKSLIGIQFAWCPPGEFLMGSPKGEGAADEHGEDGEQVRVRFTNGFWIAKTEVTQGQWTGVMGSTDPPWAHTIRNDDLFPASKIGRDRAVTFCKQLTIFEKENSSSFVGRFRLPTEAEWEYACRAGSNTRFCFGNEEKLLADFARYRENGYRLDPTFETEDYRVAQKSPNNYGIFDMHGSLWEWCQDRYLDRLSGGTGPVYQEPEAQDVAQSPGVDSDLNFVMRGGSWFDEADFARSALRAKRQSSEKPNWTWGFRVVFEN